MKDQKSGKIKVRFQGWLQDAYAGETEITMYGSLLINESHIINYLKKHLILDEVKILKIVEV